MRGEWMGGALLGGAGMWFFDPRSGKRRRALVRDQTRRNLRLLGDGIETGAWDLTHVVSGAFAEAQAALLRDTASDRVVKARIRSTMGRCVSHPGAIRVRVQNGMAVLSGPILAREYEPLLDALLAIRGVRGLESNLAVYERAGALPALQGGVERREAQGWRPASRFVAGTLGVAALISIPFLPRGRRWVPLIPAKLLLIRASTRRTVPQMLGIGMGRRLIEFERSIVIDRPYEEVARFLADIENFPRFIDDLEQVETLGAGRSQLQFIGPARIRFIAETERTDDGQGDRITWRSVRGSPRHEVDIRLFPDLEERTRVAVRVAYTPPAGYLGHLTAVFLRRRPSQRLARGLMQLKGLLERRQKTSTFSDVEESLHF